MDLAESDKSTNPNDSHMGSGGIRSGASYDNAQQDTGSKDNPRKVIEEEYTGETDSDNGGDNPMFTKAVLDINSINLKLKLNHI